MAAPLTIHTDLPTPQPAWIKASFVYGPTTTIREPLPCEVLAVSSYPGQSITFRVLIQDTGSLFDFVPPHVLNVLKQPDMVQLELSDLVPFNNPTGNVSVTKCLHLPAEVDCWFRSKNLWLKGTYLCNVDWYEGNNNANLVLLENGQIGFIPNHKMIFGSTSTSRQLPKFVEVPDSWKVG